MRTAHTGYGILKRRFHVFVDLFFRTEDFVTTYYKLPCSCGKGIPIEPQRAGQEVRCSSCGKIQKAPTMMQIKNLEVLGETSPRSGASMMSPRLIVAILGFLLFLPSLVFLLHTLVNSPKPQDVTKKVAFKTYGNILQYQDGSPLDMEDRSVLLILPEHIDHLFSPIDAYHYLDTLGETPMFGYNFQENYQALKDAHLIRLTASSILLGLAVLLLLISPLLPGKPEMIDGPEGISWQ